MGRTIDELNPATVDMVDIQQALLYLYCFNHPIVKQF